MFRLLLLAAITFFTVQSANATLIVEGNFSADFSVVPDLSGSFSASFDDSVLTGVGSEAFDDLNILTSLTLVPNPYLGNVFDTTNTFIDLLFNGGALTQVIIGGATNASNVGDFNGDWAVLWQNGVFSQAVVKNLDGVNDITFSGSGTYTSRSSVPAPATLALFGLGLAGLGWSRRKKV